MSKLKIGDREMTSRLLLGTGKFGSHAVMEEAILASETDLVTVALKRVQFGDAAGDDEGDSLMQHLSRTGVDLMPNTSGVRNATEAVFAAQLAREALETNWIKLEIHPDPQYLLPDPVETLKATETLAADGFVVLPYINADPVLCKRLEDAGTAAVMPLGSPIGSNNGLQTRGMLEIIIQQSQVPVVIDAGLGVPSHAASAMEMGADAVLINTAIAVAEDPVQMAKAFKLAVEAGRMAYESIIGRSSTEAVATSPLTSFLDKP